MYRGGRLCSGELLVALSPHASGLISPYASLSFISHVSENISLHSLLSLILFILVQLSFESFSSSSAKEEFKFVGIAILAIVFCRDGGVTLISTPFEGSLGLEGSTIPV